MNTEKEKKEYKTMFSGRVTESKYKKVKKYAKKHNKTIQDVINEMIDNLPE